MARLLLGLLVISLVWWATIWMLTHALLALVALIGVVLWLRFGQGRHQSHGRS